MAEEEIDPSIPPYHISEVLVEGHVHGDRADLTVRITVEINRNTGWHDVPLRLGQAHIYRDFSSGPGLQLPASPALQDDGLHWRFRGKGTHNLEFQLGVPVRTTPSGKQLQLWLPMMPALFEARAKLTLEGTNLSVRSVNREASLRPLVVDPVKKTTLVEAGLPGGRLELTWQDRAMRPPADGAATTNYTLRRRGALWDLEAVQSINRMEATRSDLLIRPPEGFTTVGVSGVSPDSGGQLESWSQSEERPGWIRLNLSETGSERVTLKWKLERPFLQGGGPIALNGFEIEGVRMHDGRLRVGAIPGFQILPVDESLRYLERVDDMPANGEQPALMTYSFSAAGWEMSLLARKIEPVFACKPRMDLLVREDLATLTANFEIREEAGDVQTLVVDFAEIEKAGWNLIPGSRINGVAAQFLRKGSHLEFEWPAGSTGRKSAEVRFERPVSGAEFAFDLPMPQPRATWQELPVVAVRAADPLRIDVAGGSTTSDTRADTGAAENIRLLEVYQPASPDGRLSVRGSVEARTISATTNVVVESVEASRLTIEQQVVLDVRYGRIDSLRLLIPDGFPVTPGAERLAFQVWIDGREILATEWTSGAIRVPFPRPRIGLVRVAVRYALPRTGEQSAMKLPVVLTPDVKYQQITMEASPASGLHVVSDPSLWREITTSSDRRRWIADPGSTFASIEFEAERRSTDERCIIAAGFVNTEAAGGIQRTVARYRITRHGESLSFRLPRTASLNDISVNGQPVELVPAPAPTQESEWRVKMPTNQSATPVELLISFDVNPAASRGAIGRLMVVLPEFAEGTFVEQQIWKLNVPEADLLLVSPSDWTRLFEWKRKGLFWQRAISRQFTDLLTVSGFNLDEAEQREGGYAFRQVGASSSLSVWTIDRSLVVLIGAGVTLVLGFIFWSVRPLQNVVTILVLGFLLCVAGLWVSEAILVLLQPALIGVGMATIATAIDGRARKGRRRLPPHESSIQAAVRTPPAKVSDPMRSTILRPAGSDHGVS